MRVVLTGSKKPVSLPGLTQGWTTRQNLPSPGTEEGLPLHLRPACMNPPLPEHKRAAYLLVRPDNSDKQRVNSGRPFSVQEGGGRFWHAWPLSGADSGGSP